MSTPISMLIVIMLLFIAIAPDVKPWIRYLDILMGFCAGIIFLDALK